MRLSFVVVLFLVAAAFAQEQPSLADAARAAKTPQAKAKVVVDDDNLKSSKSPIPDVYNDAIENADEIVKAIFEFQAKHTPKETEDVVREWWERHDKKMNDALIENKELKERREALARQQLGYIQSGHYDKYNKLEDAELRGAREDERRVRDNNFMVARIQNTFTQVRNALIRKNLKYEWFKIRCGNNNCSF